MRFITSFFQTNIQVWIIRISISDYLTHLATLIPRYLSNTEHMTVVLPCGHDRGLVICCLTT